MYLAASSLDHTYGDNRGTRMGPQRQHQDQLLRHLKWGHILDRNVEVMVNRAAGWWPFPSQYAKDPEASSISLLPEAPPSWRRPYSGSLWCGDHGDSGPQILRATAFLHPPTTLRSPLLCSCMGRRGMWTINGWSMDSPFVVVVSVGGGCSDNGADGSRNFLYDAMNGRWGAIRI